MMESAFEKILQQNMHMLHMHIPIIFIMITVFAESFFIDAFLLSSKVS